MGTSGQNYIEHPQMPVHQENQTNRILTWISSLILARGSFWNASQKQVWSAFQTFDIVLSGTSIVYLTICTPGRSAGCLRKTGKLRKIWDRASQPENSTRIVLQISILRCQNHVWRHQSVCFDEKKTLSTSKAWYLMKSGVDRAIIRTGLHTLSWAECFYPGQTFVATYPNCHK